MKTHLKTQIHQAIETERGRKREKIHVYLLRKVFVLQTYRARIVSYHTIQMEWNMESKMNERRKKMTKIDKMVCEVLNQYCSSVPSYPDTYNNA